MRSPWAAPRAALALVFGAAVVAASAPTATTTTPSSTDDAAAATILVTGTALPVLVTETEPCALLCYAAACEDSACATGDFACVCGNPNSLVVKLGLCTGRDCDGHAQFDSGAWIARLCGVYSAGAPAADVASASSVLEAEIRAAAATATTNPAGTAVASETGTTTETGTATRSTAAATATAKSSADRTRLPRLLWAAAAGLGLVL